VYLSSAYALKSRITVVVVQPAGLGQFVDGAFIEYISRWTITRDRSTV
jgi:hypothetical protein